METVSKTFLQDLSFAISVSMSMSPTYLEYVFCILYVDKIYTANRFFHCFYVSPFWFTFLSFPWFYIIVYYTVSKPIKFEPIWSTRAKLWGFEGSQNRLFSLWIYHVIFKRIKKFDMRLKLEDSVSDTKDNQLSCTILLSLIVWPKKTFTAYLIWTSEVSW